MEPRALIEAAERRIVVDETVRASLETLAHFLGNATWTPDQWDARAAEQAILWGFVMQEVGHRPSFQPL